MLIDTLSEMEGNCLRGKHHTLPQVTSPAKESQTQALSPEATPYKPKSHTDAADGSQDVCPNVDLALLGERGVSDASRNKLPLSKTDPTTVMRSATQPSWVLAFPL